MNDNNLDKKAAALHYSASGAPRVVAKGLGHIAGQIETVAREHGVPVVQDDVLAETLARIPLEEEIPPALYLAVAEILAFIYYPQQGWRSGKLGE